MSRALAQDPSMTRLSAAKLREAVAVIGGGVVSNGVRCHTRVPCAAHRHAMP